MALVVPFRIAVPDTRLQSLAQKLETISFLNELDEAGWDYGAPLTDIKRLTEYWKTEYDWRNKKPSSIHFPTTRPSSDVTAFGHSFRVPAQ